MTLTNIIPPFSLGLSDFLIYLQFPQNSQLIHRKSLNVKHMFSSFKSSQSTFGWRHFFLFPSRAYRYCCSCAPLGCFAFSVPTERQWLYLIDQQNTRKGYKIIPNLHNDLPGWTVSSFLMLQFSSGYPQISNMKRQHFKNPSTL